MIYRVIMQPAAEVNASEIYHFIRASSPLNAERWVQGLNEAVESLSDMPRRCKLAPESRTLQREIRQKSFGVYRILFVIEDDEVHIVHIRHGARRAWNPEAE